MVILIFGAAGREAKLQHLVLMDSLNCATSRTSDKLLVIGRGVTGSVPVISQRFKDIALSLAHQNRGERSEKDPTCGLGQIVSKRHRIAAERQMRTRPQDLLQTLGTHNRYAWSHSKTESCRGRLRRYSGISF